jgi:hypothetical protein
MPEPPDKEMELTAIPVKRDRPAKTRIKVFFRCHDGHSSCRRQGSQMKGELIPLSVSPFGSQVPDGLIQRDQENRDKKISCYSSCPLSYAAFRHIVYGKEGED